MVTEPPTPPARLYYSLFYLTADLVTPVVLETIFIVYGWQWLPAEIWDFFVWLGSVGVGVLCLWRLPITINSRAAATFVYVMFVAPILALYYIVFALSLTPL